MNYFERNQINLFDHLAPALQGRACACPTGFSKSDLTIGFPQQVLEFETNTSQSLEKITVKHITR